MLFGFDFYCELLIFLVTLSEKNSLSLGFEGEFLFRIQIASASLLGALIWYYLGDWSLLKSCFDPEGVWIQADRPLWGLSCDYIIQGEELLIPLQRVVNFFDFLSVAVHCQIILLNLHAEQVWELTPTSWVWHIHQSRNLLALQKTSGSENYLVSQWLLDSWVLSDCCSFPFGNHRFFIFKTL